MVRENQSPPAESSGKAVELDEEDFVEDEATRVRALDPAPLTDADVDRLYEMVKARSLRAKNAGRKSPIRRHSPTGSSKRKRAALDPDSMAPVAGDLQSQPKNARRRRVAVNRMVIVAVIGGIVGGLFSGLVLPRLTSATRVSPPPAAAAPLQAARPTDVNPVQAPPRAVDLPSKTQSSPAPTTARSAVALPAYTRPPTSSRAADAPPPSAGARHPSAPGNPTR